MADGWITFPDGVSTATNATVTGLDPNTYYEFQVIATNGDGDSTPSNIDSVTTVNNVPAPAIVTLQGQTPTLIPGTVTVAVDTAILTLTGQTPTLAPSSTAPVTPDAALLTLTGQTPTPAGAGTGTATVDPATLTLTGQTPPLTGSAAATRTVDTATLTLTGETPTLAGSSASTKAVDPATLTLTGETPTLTSGEGIATVDSAALVLQGQDVATAGSGDATVAVDPATVALEGVHVESSTGAGDQSRSVDPADLLLTGETPTLSGVGAITTDIDPALLTLTGEDPTVDTGTVSVAVDPATLTLTGETPTLEGGGDLIGDVDPATLTLTGEEPTLSGSGDLTVAVDPADLILTGEELVLSADGELASRDIDPADLLLEGVHVEASVGEGDQSRVVDPADLLLEGIVPDLAGTGDATVEVDPATILLYGQEIPLPAPASVPGAPTLVNTEANSDGSISLTWTPPVSDGGSPLTDYIVQYRTIPVSDNFNRADGGLGPNWDDTGGSLFLPVPISNTKASAIDSEENLAAYVGATFSGDHFAEADITIASVGSSQMDAAVRVNLDPTDPTFYIGWIDNIGSRAVIYKYFGNSWFFWNGPAGGLPANLTSCRMRLEAEGETIRLYVDGVLQVEAVDALPLVGGSPGLYGWATTTPSFGTADNFQAGELWTTYPDAVSTGTTANVTGLDAATTYEFRVLAVNGVGTGPPSNTLTATTLNIAGLVTCQVFGVGVARKVYGPASQTVTARGPGVRVFTVRGPGLEGTAFGPALLTILTFGPGIRAVTVRGPDVSRDIFGAKPEELAVKGPGMCHGN